MNEVQSRVDHYKLFFKNIGIKVKNQRRKEKMLKLKKALS